MTSDPPPWDQSSILHYPSTTDGASYLTGVPVNFPVDQVIASATSSISRFDYAIVLLHPQEFAAYVDNKMTGEIDQNAMNRLSQLVDSVRDKANIVQIQEISVIPVPEFSKGKMPILVVSVMMLVLAIARRGHRGVINPGNRPVVCDNR